jgi:hypothetical protein
VNFVTTASLTLFKTGDFDFPGGRTFAVLQRVEVLTYLALPALLSDSTPGHFPAHFVRLGLRRRCMGGVDCAEKHEEKKQNPSPLRRAAKERPPGKSKSLCKVTPPATF